MVSFAAVFAISASACGLMRAWPQAIRLLRSGDTNGISATTWILSLVTNAIWLILGLKLNVLALIFHNALSAIGPCAVLYLLVRHKQLTIAKPLLYVAAAVVVSVLSIAVAGEAGISVLGIAISLFAFAPQAVRVARHPSSGVSLTTWTFALVSAVLWMIYGTLIEKFALVAPGFVIVPMTLFIIWRIVRPIEVAPAPQTEPEPALGA